MRLASFLATFCVALCLFGGCDEGGSQQTDNTTGSPNGTTPRDAHDKEVASCIAAMLSPERDAWQKPDEVVAALNLRPGERVADVGAGPGYFSLRLANAVGPSGKIWATDIARAALDRLRDRATEAKLTNIECILTAPNKPSLPDGEVDTVLLVNTYYYFSDPKDYMTKLRKALAPGGRIVIIDLIPKTRADRGFGPPLKEQVAREQVDATMAAVGFEPTAVHGFLPEQYFVEYRPSE